MIRLLAYIILLVCCLAPVSHAGAADKVSLRLIPALSAAVPGQNLPILIEQTIAPGWHTYWLNPGDSGAPMALKWQDGSLAALDWPLPARIPYGPMVNFGYHNQALLRTVVPVPASAQTSFTLAAHINVLVCNDICIPEAHDLTLTLPVATSATPVNESAFASAAAKMPQKVAWPTTTKMDETAVQVRITLPPDMADIVPEALTWFPLHWGYIENIGPLNATLDTATNTLILDAPRISGRDLSALPSLDYLLDTNKGVFLISGTQHTLAPAPIAPDMPQSIALLFGLALLGGLLLNLMPCVFPVLSMKALHLLGATTSERAHARFDAALYAAGIMTSFVALGALMLALRAAGAGLGWGFQLQNPVFVGAMACLLYVIGLNLAGFFELAFSLGGRFAGPRLGAFASGVLATLVATPCTAPFMAGALGAALVQPWPVALGIFVFLGAGLALPFLLLSFVPALQKLLPKPGAWMGTLRKILAYPMFASAVWLVWVLAKQAGLNAVAIIAFIMLAITFGLWLAKKHIARAWPLTIIAAALLSLGALGSTPPMHNARAFDVEAFDHALNDGDAPILVNMGAAWCITCLFNDKTVLDTKATKDLLIAHKVFYFKGDWTNQDPVITAFLRRFGRSGVPLYVYYGPRDPITKSRPQPRILPQLLTKDALRAALQP